MKLENIKTEEEFYEFADIWYQRVHKLREVWQNENETDKRRQKAFRLFGIMTNRVMKLMPMATKLRTPKIPKNVIIGGITHK